jgi:hypothetical protein
MPERPLLVRMNPELLCSQRSTIIYKMAVDTFEARFTPSSRRRAACAGLLSRCRGWWGSWLALRTG